MLTITQKSTIEEMMEKSTSELEEYHLQRLLDHENDFEDLESFFDELAAYGCINGAAQELIYTHNCLLYFQKFTDEITDKVVAIIEETGIHNMGELFRNRNASDPLAHYDGNQSLLAHFTFEETMRNIADQLGFIS